MATEFWGGAVGAPPRFALQTPCRQSPKPHREVLGLCHQQLEGNQAPAESLGGHVGSTPDLRDPRFVSQLYHLGQGPIPPLCLSSP